MSKIPPLELPMHGDWHEGWLMSARQLPSPNFGDRPKNCAVDLIVVHSISLPPGQYGGQFISQFFTNCLDRAAHPYFETIENMRVSAHFFIARNGAIEQFVSVNSRSWHAGVSGFLGRDQCNDFSVGIELEGTETDVFTAAQYKSLACLCLRLKAQYPGIAHVVGHEHIAPGRKFDPGLGFDWKLLQLSTGWPTRYFPVLPADT